ncbi:right-handed parallel beta-helix repeat-containing protein [Vibrio sp. RC27]
MLQLESKGELSYYIPSSLNVDVKLAAFLLFTAVANERLVDVIEESVSQHFDVNSLLHLAFILNTDDPLQFAKNILYSRSLDFEKVIESFSQYTGINSQPLSAYAESLTESYRITPLIESASITLYRRSEHETAQVSFRKKHSQQWKQSFDLQWEPISRSLSGSIVYLEPNTEYDVKVTLFNSSERLSTSFYSFTTWPNTPPIDNNKVFKLSDIYEGGPLDLTKLGISGSKSGWAVIEGDPTTPIVVEEGSDSAINIGSNSYVYFKNITVNGGVRNAIRSEQAHHLWFDGCDISGWGRTGEKLNDGRYYDEKSRDLINYDSAFYLKQTGVVVVENCHVHSPKGSANNWSSGHPAGPNAYLAWASHPNSELSGQVVLRNNHFYGKSDHRFNDVIEGYKNGYVYGGFVRDSAIYNNKLEYANDDIIEIDGGQSNVLLYNNDISNGYVGISAIPNVKGPSFIFNNHVYSLGDDSGKSWASIKLGGLKSRPKGKTNIFYNLIRTNSNGISYAGYLGDSSFWADARSNVIIHDFYSKNRGFSIYDKYPSGLSNFSNNYMFNIITKQPLFDAQIAADFYDIELVNDNIANSIWHSPELSTTFNIPEALRVPNMTKVDGSGAVIIGYTYP